MSLFFFFYYYGHHLDLHSFPTRRSSDLMRLALADRLKERHRVILLDRPGHGWSEREADDASPARQAAMVARSEEHTSELQSPDHLVCRLLLEKKKKRKYTKKIEHHTSTL